MIFILKCQDEIVISFYTRAWRVYAISYTHLIIPHLDEWYGQWLLLIFISVRAHSPVLSYPWKCVCSAVLVVSPSTLVNPSEKNINARDCLQIIDIRNISFSSFYNKKVILIPLSNFGKFIIPFQLSHVRSFWLSSVNALFFFSIGYSCS